MSPVTRTLQRCVRTRRMPVCRVPQRRQPPRRSTGPCRAGARDGARTRSSPSPLLVAARSATLCRADRHRALRSARRCREGAPEQLPCGGVVWIASDCFAEMRDRAREVAELQVFVASEKRRSAPSRGVPTSFSRLAMTGEDKAASLAMRRIPGVSVGERASCEGADALPRTTLRPPRAGCLRTSIGRAGRRSCDSGRICDCGVAQHRRAALTGSP